MIFLTGKKAFLFESPGQENVEKQKWAVKMASSKCDFQRRGYDPNS
jgi:hypothetical protein